ncbi:hypothetical protein [Pseudochrobactrum sp. B5]|uniref:hypothetical protein n=1 Tax=Pseudochrobactrum sp. B5 TaxID=1289478 RepID=UPI000A570864|nr:hypothetical protein [Pseudochrobactrum sp. B5]
MAETIKRGQRAVSASPVGGVTGDMKLMNGVAWLMLRGLFLHAEQKAICKKRHEHGAAYRLVSPDPNAQGRYSVVLAFSVRLHNRTLQTMRIRQLLATEKSGLKLMLG